MAEKPTCKESEQNLKELERIFNLSIDMIGSGNLDGYFTRVNSSFKQILGYAEEEITEKPFLFFVHDEDVEKTKEALDGAANGKETIYIDNRYRCKDGAFKWISWRVLSVRSEHKFIAVGRDITKQKQAEDALGKSENKLKDFLNSATDSFVIFDSELNIIDVNEIHLEMFHPGMNKEDLAGQNLLDIVPNLKQTGRFDDLMKVIQTGTPFYSDNIVPQQKFGDRILSVKAFKLACGLGTITRDVTQQKLEELKYKLLADNVTDAIFVVRLDELTFEYASPSIETVFGYTVEEFMDFNIYDLLLPFSVDLVTEILQQEIEKNNYGKAEPQLLELEVIRKDGLQICVGVSARFLRDNEGHVTGILCVARDISEMKKAEEALREEKEFTETALNAQQDTFFLFDPATGKAIRWNQSFNDITGYTDEEIVGMVAPESYYSLEDLERVNIFTQNILKTETSTIELDLICKDGQKVPTEYRISAIKDEKGKPKYFISIGRDIRKRKQAEEALIKSEKMHRLLAENARDMIFRQSLPDGRFEYVSSASVSLLGYKPEELYNKPTLLEKVVHPDSAECFEEQWKNLVNGDISSHYEYKIISRTGETRWVYQRSILIVDNKTGRPIAIEGIISDVTKQKLAEIVLRESEVKHKTLVKNIPGMVYRAYPDWSADVISGSEAVCGYTKNELASKVDNWLSIIPPDERERVSKEGYSLIKAQQGIVQTYQIKTKDGDIRWVEDHKSSIFSETGEFIGIDGVIFDITDRKQAEEELNKTNERLEEKVKERTSEIEEKSIALKVLLDQRGGDKKKLEEAIMSNVKELLIPNINRLRNSALTSKQQSALNVLESNLNEIISPFVNSASSIFMNLTPTEIQVANFIKHGMSSKDIAESLSLSQRTVDTHRYNIRKKLGLSGKGSNLRTYLLSMT